MYIFGASIDLAGPVTVSSKTHALRGLNNFVPEADTLL